jgi:predicted RecB family nuclease
LLPGLQPAAVAKLAAIGVNDLQAFVQTDPERLRSVPGFRDSSTLLRARAQATAHLTGQLVVVGVPALPARAEHELLLDFEADPLTRAPFLAGLMIRHKTRTKYVPFVAQSARGIARMSRDFLRVLVKESADVTVYHYGSFEARVLRGLAAPRGIDLGALEQRLVDVLPFVRRHAGIPSKTFALKDVARVLGMPLPVSDLDGRSAPMWWEAWVRTRQASLHRRLLAYNKMDLVALAGVLDWLRGDYVAR